jgi:SHS2 domain-containing protein
MVAGTVEAWPGEEAFWRGRRWAGVSDWRIVEHTADVGLEAEGESLEATIEATIEGFGELVCPEGEVEPRQTRELTIEARNLDNLVVDTLDELNYVHQVDRFVPARGRARLARTEEGHRLVLEVDGETYDRERHGHLMEIKATTYHELTVDLDGRIAVLFDV